jgi:hypothetical protein
MYKAASDVGILNRKPVDNRGFRTLNLNSNLPMFGGMIDSDLEQTSNLTQPFRGWQTASSFCAVRWARTRHAATDSWEVG